MEFWRDITGYEGWYQVSNFGRVRRIKPAKGATIGKPLRPGSSKYGYQRVVLSRDKVCQTFDIHRLVAIAFFGPPKDDKDVVAHNDGNPRNNRLANLRWDTREGNEADKSKHGTLKHGESHYRTTITVEDVVAILQDNRKHKDIALSYGLTSAAISAIKVGKNWSHVTADKTE